MSKTPPTLPLDAYLRLSGTALEPGDWVLVDQAAIDAFAEATGDRQFIHVDPERARETPFGGTIAHAFLVLSLLGGTGIERMPGLSGATMGLNYGFERIRFVSPVRSGKRVRVRLTIKAVEQRRPDQVLTTLDVAVEIEGEDKPALVAEWLVLHMLQSSGAP